MIQKLDNSSFFSKHVNIIINYNLFEIKSYSSQRFYQRNNNKNIRWNVRKYSFLK